MNIYLHELKSLRKSTIIWILSLLSLAVIYFSIYPSIVKDAADFKALISAYPPAVLAVLGVTLDNLTSLLGFYTLIFSFITLFGAIQAMNLGLSILSKEARERTADFLLFKPVSRKTIVTSKILASITMLVITNILYFAFALFLANLVKTDDYSVKLFFMINLTLFFIQLIFFAIGLVISVLLPKIKSVLPISLGVVFGLFIAGAFLATDAKDLARYISPFKYFDMSYIIKNSSYESSYLITGILIILLSVVTSYVIYIKKDVHSVS